VTEPAHRRESSTRAQGERSESRSESRGGGAPRNPEKPDESILYIKDLRTFFFLPARGRFIRAVDGVSLAVKPGETLVVVGESGSGKSVTMLSVMGLVSGAPGIVSGRIWYRKPGDPEAVNLLEGLERFSRVTRETSLCVEKDTRGWERWHDSGMKERRGRDFAMIFQNPRNALHPFFTVGQQVSEAIRRRSPEISSTEALEEAEGWLARVHLDSPSKRLADYPHNLSGGMCQRVMIAMTLAARPKVLIADEPTTGLDATIQSRVLDLMEEMKAELRTTTIVITHDMGVARRLADRVAVMYAGRVVEVGRAKEVLDRAHEPKHPYAYGLLGAIPTLEDIRARRRLSVIEGDVPDLSRLGSGCQFVSRCAVIPPSGEERCRETEPELEKVGPEHRLRCWLHAGAGARG
jgi:oligopeptide/dipeptide ABC transporter ATP-binding protein